MAQTNFTPISLYYSATAAAVPTAGNLVAGELAINTADGKLFYKDSAGVVQVIGTKGGVGSSTNTQVLYNSSGLVVGSANMTFNGTTLTVADLTDSSLTVNRVVYAGTGGNLVNSANFTFNGTTVTMANDASISGLTVGKGGGNIGTNTATGNLALRDNTTGTNNSGIGIYALVQNTTGANNTAVGGSPLYSNTTGSQNTALGTTALYNNTTASNNTAIGYQAGFSNTTGTALTAVGYLALTSATAGNATAVGSRALQSLSTQNACTAVGKDAARLTTTGYYIDAFGQDALAANTTGFQNCAFGTSSLLSNTIGNNNTAVGYQALYNNTTAINNTAIGYQAGSNVTTSNYSVFLGSRTASTGVSGITGNYHTCVGDAAGLLLQGASTNNAFIGQYAGANVTTGSKHTIIGSYSGNQDGLDIRTAFNYAVISDGDGNRLLTSWNGGTTALQGAVPNTGCGITFPATQNASSNANTLDDYEEGTWTPVIVMDSGTSTGGTFNGTYIKIGRQVTLTIYADVGTVASSPAIRGFSGLPFTSLNSSQQAVGAIRENSSTGFMWMWRVDANTTLSLLRRYDNASGLTNNMQFTGTVTYFVP